MSLFWTLSNGQMPTGSAEDAHTASFGLIPDGTTALAIIKSVAYQDEWKSYNIQWKIIGGEFKNRVVFQKLYCFDEKPEKRDKALQMLMRILILCNCVPKHKEALRIEDLNPLMGNILGIKILEWHMNDKEGNYIGEIYESEGFESRTGIYATNVAGNGLDSALTRHANKNNKEMPDDDIPFF